MKPISLNDTTSIPYGKMWTIPNHCLGFTSGVNSIVQHLCVYSPVLPYVLNIITRKNSWFDHLPVLLELPVGTWYRTQCDTQY